MRNAPDLLRVASPAGDFAPLAAAARELGLRIGWLELGPAAPPPGLAPALEAGCTKAVELGPQGSLAAKARRGPAVLADVLREHFAGHALVLVHGEGLALPAETERLEGSGDGFVVVGTDGSRRPFVARDLRRPGREGR